jgi:hypothetical protein
MSIRRNDTDVVADGSPCRPTTRSRGAGSSAAPARSGPNASACPTSLAFQLAESLLRVRSSHLRAIMDVRNSRKELERARAYLDTPGSHESLARAYLEVRRISHARHLDELRRLRHQAWELIEFVDALPAASIVHRPWSNAEVPAALSRSRC